MQKRTKKRGKLYTALLKSYFVVSILFICSCILLMCVSLNIAAGIIRDDYINRTQYFGDIMDRALLSVETGTAELIRNPELLSYSRVTDPSPDISIEYKKKGIQEEIKSIIFTNSEIQSMFVCFVNNDVMLSNTGTYRNLQLDDQIITLLGMTYQELKELANQISYNRFFISNANADGENKLYLLQRVYGDGYKKHTAFVVSIIDTNTLTSKLLNEEERLAVISDEHTEYRYEFQSSLFRDATWEDVLEADAAGKTHLMGMYFYHTSSERADWSYYLVTDQSDYLHTIWVLISIFLSILIITISANIVLVRFTSRKVYSPIEKLHNKVLQHVGDTENDYDEIQHIETAFKKAEQDVRDMAEDKYFTPTSANAITLNTILFLDYWPNEEDRYRIGLYGERFIVIVFSLEFIMMDVDSHFESQMIFTDKGEEISGTRQNIVSRKNLSKENQKLYDFVIANVMEELLRASYPTVVFTLGDSMPVCLINVSELDVNAEQILPDLEESLDKGRLLLNERMGIFFSAAISEITDRHEQVVEQYIKTRDYLRRQLIMGNLSRIERFQDKTDSLVDSYGWWETDRKIYFCIQEENYKTAYQLIDYLFEHELSSELLQSPAFRFRMYGLQYALAGALFNSKIRIHHLKNGMNPTHALIYCETLSEFREVVDMIFEEIQKTEAPGTKEPVSERSQQIMDFILSNAYNRNLCVDMVCAEFDITPSYFSRLFKQANNKTFPQYLHEIRIANAKTLLLNTDISINEIAEMVGFDNRRTFDRVFKTAEQITSSEYRQKNRRED